MRMYVLLPLFFLLALFCLLRGGLGQSMQDENTRVLAALGSGAKAPIFNAYFPTNPSPIVNSPLNYTWAQSDPADNSTTAAYHQGVAILSGGPYSYIDVNIPTGSQSCGVVLPQIGGAGSGTGASQGWTVDVVVKLTGAVGGWAKLIDFGDGAAIGSTTNDLMLTWDGNDNNETGLVPGLAAQQLSSPPPATLYSYASCPMIKPVLDQWYHIALVMQAVNVSAASATWYIYVNGQLLPYSTNLQSGATFTALQGANLPLPLARPQSYIGKSDYIGDADLSAVFDAVRVYDYALSASQVTGIAAAYNLNTGVSLPQNSNSQSLPTTSETNFWQKAGISRAPVLNAVFPADPASVIAANRAYQWSATDATDSGNVSTYHQGVVTLTGGATGSFIDLNNPVGPNSVGLVMGFFGGAGGSSGSSQGWTVETVMKPTSAIPYSKLLTIGNGGYLDVFFIGWDGAGQMMQVGQSNNFNINLPGSNLGSSGVNFPTTPTLNQWVHVAVVMQPTNMAVYNGTWTVYVNGQQVAQITQATYPMPTYRDQSFIGASDYQDPNAAAVYDAVRVYDQALTQSQVQLMAQQYGLSSGGTLTGGALATAAFSLPLMAVLALLALISS